MSASELDRLVCQAVLSEKFCAAVLDGQRAELIKAYNLDPEEVARLLAIHADTLPDFAAAALQVISRRQAAYSPLTNNTLTQTGGWLLRG